MLRLKTALIAFHHLPRSHTGVNITTALVGLFDCAGITDNVSLDPQLGPFLLHDYFQIGHFTLDNTANNKTAMAELERCRADSAVECILMLDYLLYYYLPLLPTYLLP